MRPSKKLEQLIENIDIDTNTKADEAVLNNAIEAFENSKGKKLAVSHTNIWRTIMKSPITKLSAAAVITLALMLNTYRFGGSINMENAAFANVSQPILTVPTDTLMLSADHTYISLLIVVNLVAGFGCAVPIARRFDKIDGKSNRFFRYFVILIGIYFLESVAIGANMVTPDISVGLAFLWGVIFGFWLRRCGSGPEALKNAFFLALYSCLPTTSFYLFIPAAKSIAGRNVLSAAEGASFGIPSWLPWPINTILGSCVALVIGIAVFKTVITTGEVSLLIHLAEKSWKKISIAGSIIIAICAFVIIALPIIKPGGPPGLVITGTVTDAITGQPIAGARISDGRYGPKPQWSTIQAGDCAAHGAITDSQGKYRYLTWPEHHTIEAQAVGYKTQGKSVYKGHLGDFFEEEKEQEKIIDFTLEPK